MALCLGAACELSVWSERLKEIASAESSTQNAVETVCLGVFTPPDSLLDRHSAVCVLVYPCPLGEGRVRVIESEGSLKKTLAGCSKRLRGEAIERNEAYETFSAACTVK